MLSIQNLSKKYGSHVVLNVPELNIPNGTFWIEGGNGSGKTTLLKIIAGIVPFEGAVSLNGIDLKKSPITYRKEISYAEAEPQYPPSLTGLELIRFIQKTRTANQSQVDQLTEHFQIGNFVNQAVGGYSSGMLKKLSLLLAFAGPQKLILLDEPLITLDVAFIPLLLATIKERQSNGVTFLITSHQAFEENMLSFDGKITVRDQTAKLVMN
jgi:ABC-2 type transport system ATP-binding protein